MSSPTSGLMDIVIIFNTQKVDNMKKELIREEAQF
jgi:hypothetical protein